MNERKAVDLLRNIKGTRREIDTAFDANRTHEVVRELEAWVRDIVFQADRGETVFEPRHLDDAHDQISIIRRAVEPGSVDHFIVASRSAVKRLGDIRRIANADSALPGIGEPIRPLRHAAPALPGIGEDIKRPPSHGSPDDDDDDDDDDRYRYRKSPSADA
jgi:hypothetical protein